MAHRLGWPMNGPFPGMDPYLEHPVLWEGVHARLMVAIANQLQPKLDPRYVASIEERVFIEGPQRRDTRHLDSKRSARLMDRRQSRDVDSDTAVIVEVDNLEIHETRVEILDSYNELKLVALIEVVSPTNKAAGPGPCVVQGETSRDARSRVPPDRNRPAQSRPPRSLHPRVAGQAIQAVRFALLCQPMASTKPLRALSAHAPPAATATSRSRSRTKIRIHRSTSRPHSNKSTSRADTGANPLRREVQASAVGRRSGLGRRANRSVPGDAAGTFSELMRELSFARRSKPNQMIDSTRLARPNGKIAQRCLRYFVMINAVRT